MTVDDLVKIKESLEECYPDVEYFSWGPTYTFAKQRREAALKLLKKEIRTLKNANQNT